MGILASLGFFITVLFLGFRYNWNIAFLILLMSGVFATLLTFSNFDEIKQNWSLRRCDLEVMITAQLYKPSDDPRSGGEFASENFDFCTRKILTDILKVFLLPVYGLLGEQVDVVESLAEMMNRLRTMQANFMKAFTGLMSPFQKRFEATGAEFAVNYQKILMAMGRAFGITQAILYIGMSLVLAVENFINLVINVIMIVMYIILGFMIILFFLLLPVFGLIIYTCQVIGNSPFGYLSYEVCGELCFDPTTRIRLQNGLIKPIGECQVGDVLEDGGSVEGVLWASGEKEPMFVLDGIRVSGAHLVWFEEKQTWIAAAQHPSASLSMTKCHRLVCLRTSTRNIPLQGLSKLWVFRDWEELPSNLPTADAFWDVLVSQILNQKPSNSMPEAHPLLRKSCQVMFKTGEMRSVGEVKIGDCIYSSEGFTTVTGVYKGREEFGEGQQMTDGVWLKSIGETQWTHPPSSPKTEQQEGFHLTTESGCFWIQTNEFSGYIRDFTEVGAQNLFLTYNYTRSLLKKSFNREESCVSDSLSQVLLSSSQLIS